ncbi:MAG: hypothetical protein R2909_14740 [Gemmatimonadales bacterium]
MGFGCNAAGVVATRIHRQPHPNYWWRRSSPTISRSVTGAGPQILIASVFLGTLAPAPASLLSGGAVVGVALLGIAAMFVASWLLTHTVLTSRATTFSLELPPYRPPRLLETLYTSLIDRTLIVLWRAVVFAAPAGAVIWLSANLQIGGVSLARH